MSASIRSIVPVRRTPIWVSTSCPYICLRCRHQVSLFPLTPSTARPLSSTSERPINDGIEKVEISPRQDWWRRKIFGEEEAAKQTQFVIEGEEKKPQRPEFRKREIDDPDYKPASTWHGLESIGGPTGWWEKEWDQEHQFFGLVGEIFVPSPSFGYRTKAVNSYMMPKKVEDPKLIAKCINRAIKEIYTLSQAGLPLKVNTPLGRDFDSSAAKVWRTVDGAVEVRWTKEKVRQEALAFLTESMEDITRREEDEALEEEAARLEEEMEGEIEQPAAENEIHETETAEGNARRTHEAEAQTRNIQAEEAQAKEAHAEEAQGPEAEITSPIGQRAPVEDENQMDEEFFEDGEPTGVVQEQLEDTDPASLGGKRVTTASRSKFYIMSFENQDIKFAVITPAHTAKQYTANPLKIIKRAMQLLGHRLSDPTIANVHSTERLFATFSKKPKPQTVADSLRQIYEKVPHKRNQTNITKSNVIIQSKKYKPRMKETALGRQKVIEQELDKAGLYVPYKDYFANFQHKSTKEREKDMLVET
ncbi:MAG: hypothetical protein LQ342_003586 [Letrouitia transgressa]|nr:MAG: hypothetical protein LQ342_003586 [Letrouitia transgressa]